MKNLKSFRSLIDKYDFFLFDQWGVLHNGHYKFKEAENCLRVLKNNPDKMPKIFFEMFKASSNSVIKFLSNKSNIFEDISIVSRMPKLIFMRALFH